MFNDVNMDSGTRCHKVKLSNFHLYETKIFIEHLKRKLSINAWCTVAEAV